jgi:hypothetical protein
VQRKATNSGAELKPREDQLVDRDRRETRERDGERMVMKKRHAEQRQPEQDKIDRNAQQIDRRSRLGGSSNSRRCRAERGDKAQPDENRIPPTRSAM